jgi:GNAT superfamily N-acetyltransferase
LLVLPPEDSGTPLAPDACAVEGCFANETAGDREPAQESADAGCEDSARTLTRRRLDLLAVLDNASSMAQRWPAILQALERFYVDPSSRGLGIGLQLSGTTCIAADYTNPRVPIAALPGNAAAMRRGLLDVTFGETSTLPMIQGGALFAQAWQESNADAKTAVIVVTDGSPSSCDNSAQLYEAAADTLRAGPPIPIYVVSFSGTFIDTVRLFAAAAGIMLEVELAGDAPESIAAAFDAVRAQAQPCAFALPEGTTLVENAYVEQRDTDGALVRHQLAVNFDCTRNPDGFVLLPDAHAYRIVGCPQACAGTGSPSSFVLRTDCRASQAP